MSNGNPKNVLGGELQPCGLDPLTGFYRDGCCNTSAEDFGRHTVCAVMTEPFLVFSAERGNDLSTPRPEFRFPGLKPGASVPAVGERRPMRGWPRRWCWKPPTRRPSNCSRLPTSNTTPCN